jgi:hypothetical protein
VIEFQITIKLQQEYNEEELKNVLKRNLPLFDSEKETIKVKIVKK